MNMLDEYAKITEATKEKTEMEESAITDEFIEKLAKKVASVLMQSADESENNENENNENENNENENENDNENDNENE